jgi:hypothetical protein
MRLYRLSDLGVKKSKPGAGGKDKLYGDGGGLWLRVTGDEAAPARSWIFRYERKGKARRMGLGAYPDISLQSARERAQGLRRLLADGKDPFDERRAQVKAAALAAAKQLPFMECATQYIDSHRAGWSEKHAADWETSLKMHAEPAFEGLSVQEIERDHVVKALRPIWETKTETATRVRGRIEAVLSWASVAGYRTGENPALWKGNLDHMLVKPSKIQIVEHHPALPYAEMGGFMTALRDENGTAARALEFAILNATRTMEIRLADWSEIEWTGKMWVIPGPISK